LHAEALTSRRQLKSYRDFVAPDIWPNPQCGARDPLAKTAGEVSGPNGGGHPARGGAERFSARLLRAASVSFLDVHVNSIGASPETSLQTTNPPGQKGPRNRTNGFVYSHRFRRCFIWSVNQMILHQPGVCVRGRRGRNEVSKSI